MGLKFKCPTLDDVERVRQWRNAAPEILRTSHLLTKEQQERFYRDVICDPASNTRWWSVYWRGDLAGFVGFVNIQWENGLAEISFVMSPSYQAVTCGAEVLKLLLDEGFGNMGLLTIYGECYECNTERLKFWERMVDKHGGYKTTIPRRKRWRGQLYDALHFSFWR